MDAEAKPKSKPSTGLPRRVQPAACGGQLGQAGSPRLHPWHRRRERGAGSTAPRRMTQFGEALTGKTHAQELPGWPFPHPAALTLHSQQKRQRPVLAGMRQRCPQADPQPCPREQASPCREVPHRISPHCILVALLLTPNPNTAEETSPGYLPRSGEPHRASPSSTAVGKGLPRPSSWRRTCAGPHHVQQAFLMEQEPLQSSL